MAEKKKPQSLNTAISLNMPLDVVKYLVRSGCKPTTETYNSAVKMGRLDIMNYFNSGVIKGGHKAVMEHLDTAISYGHLHIVKYLVVEGEYKVTSAHLETAIQKRYCSIVNFIISDGGCKPTTEHLDFVIRSGYHDILKLLVVKGERKPTTKHLDIAILKGYYDIVKYLVVEYGCKPTTEHLNTAFSKAFLYDDNTVAYIDIVRCLIVDGGCKPTTEHLNTAFRMTCYNGGSDVSILKCLVVDGECKPTAEHLSTAIEKRYANIVKLLVVDGRCKPTTKHFDTAIEGWYYHSVILKCLVINGGYKPATEHLTTAIQKGTSSIVKCLVVDCGCKLTPDHLTIAIKNGTSDIVKCLVVDCGCKTTADHLTVAIKNDISDIVKCLVIDGGYKPATEHLTTAIQKGTSSIVKCLVVDCGCRLTPDHLTIAVKNGTSDIVKCLVVDCGCKPTPKHLTIAIQKDNFDNTKCLVDCGCKLTTEHLSIAIRIGSINIVKFLVVDCGCYITGDHLYSAVQRCDDEIAHVLIDSKHVDLNSQVGPQQRNVLHVACGTGQLSIVEHLIKDGRCNIEQTGREGNSALHFACYHGHYEIVKALLDTGNCDVNCRNVHNTTPLDLSTKPDIIRELIRHGVNQSSVYKRFGSVLGNSPKTPIEATVKVFVTGDPRGGKSTLTKSLQNETSAFFRLFVSAKKVSDVDEKTAGIIPYQFESKQYGSVTFYDLAGQREFYSSHSAVLSNTICSSPPILLLVIDLQRSEEELEQSILYWLCFLENQCSSVNGRPHLIIIGSHADILKSRGEDPEQKSSIVNVALSQLKSTWFEFSGFIPMDCQYPQSSEIERLRHQLGFSCKALRVASTIQFNCHCFLVYLIDKFSTCHAVTLKEVHDSMLACSDKNSPTNFVSLNLKVLVKLCEQLNDRGHIFFLKSASKIEDSWIIIDKAALLSEVTGTMFAPEGFKQHCKLASCTGVVPLSEIIYYFPRYNSDMLISFFSHLEFCSKIYDQETLELIEVHQTLNSMMSANSNEVEKDSVYSDTHNARSVSISTDQFFLFSGLITINRPDRVWETSFQFSFQCGWMLQCSQPTQFFSSRFLQVLLLRIAFAFALIPHRQEMDPSVPALQRKCSIWRNGIFWGDRNGVEVLMEVIEHKSVIVLMQSLHLTGKCMHLRSSIINKVLKTATDICPKVQTTESFINPSETLEYPVSKVSCFSILEVAASVSSGQKAVVATTGKSLTLESLLTFEPYAMLSPPILHRLFDIANDKEEATDDFLMDFSRACCDKKAAPHRLAVLLECLKANEIDFQFRVNQEPREYRESSVHRCFLLLKTWKDQTAHPTLQALRRVLDQHSVFGGRNPLELHQSLGEITLTERLQREEEDQTRRKEETEQSSVRREKEPKQIHNSDPTHKEEPQEVSETVGNLLDDLQHMDNVDMVDGCGDSEGGGGGGGEGGGGGGEGGGGGGLGGGGERGRGGEWVIDRGGKKTEREEEDKKEQQQRREKPQTQLSYGAGNIPLHYESGQGKEPQERYYNNIIIHTQRRTGLHARAIYDYQAACDDDVSFDVDDIIENIEQIFEEWWMGEVNGKRGLFPANHVELI